MNHGVCPHWVGYLLLNPLRKLLENPQKILGPLVAEGMTVLEPGCGMGFFTLPLAGMVGPQGRVVVVEIQAKMLAALRRRARKTGLLERIEIRRASGDRLAVDDLQGLVDLCAAIHLIHEIPDKEVFFDDVWRALKPGGKLLVIEPKGHVSAEDFSACLEDAKKVGFEMLEPPRKIPGRSVLLVKNTA